MRELCAAGHHDSRQQQGGLEGNLGATEIRTQQSWHTLVQVVLLVIALVVSERALSMFGLVVLGKHICASVLAEFCDTGGIDLLERKQLR